MDLLLLLIPLILHLYFWVYIVIDSENYEDTKKLAGIILMMLLTVFCFPITSTLGLLLLVFKLICGIVGFVKTKLETVKTKEEQKDNFQLEAEKETEKFLQELNNVHST